MTRNEAAQKLGITLDASEEEIRGKYREISADLQLRLNNAPTEHLRETFRNKMTEVESAFIVLCADIPRNEKGELPLSEQTTTGERPTTQKPAPKTAEENQSENLVKRWAYWLPLLLLALLAVFLLRDFFPDDPGKTTLVLQPKSLDSVTVMWQGQEVFSAPDSAIYQLSAADSGRLLVIRGGRLLLDSLLSLVPEQNIELNFTKKLLRQHKTYTFTRTYKGSGFAEISDAIIDDNNIVLVGTTYPDLTIRKNGSIEYERSKIFALKTDLYGNITWEKYFGRSQFNAGYGIANIPNQGYLLVGATYQGADNENDSYFIKIDTEGTVKWAKNFGGAKYEDATRVQITPDGGHIAIGRFIADNNQDIFFIKFTSDGILQRKIKFGGAKEDHINDFKITPNNNCIILGYTYSFGNGKNDIYILKTDLFGNILWEKTFGGKLDDTGDKIKLLPDGNYLIFAYKEKKGNNDESSLGWLFFLIKVDSHGNLIWEKGINSIKAPHDAELTKDGGYIVVGENSGSLNGEKFSPSLIKISREGSVEWEKTFPDFVIQGFGSIYVRNSPDGGYLIFGTTDTYKAFVIKTDANGNVN